MKQPNHKLTMSDPAVFRVCVQGRLDDHWADYFATQSITAAADEAGNVVTTLISEPMDQGALVGLINRLNTLGIPVISVECR